MRITLAEYEQIMEKRGQNPQGRPRKPSKYRSKRVRVDGILFDSSKEANRYCELKILRDEGSVKIFFRQVPVDLPGGIIYRLDFLVFWKNGEVSHEDTKGFRTPEYKLKKKQVEALYPIKIEEL